MRWSFDLHMHTQRERQRESQRDREILDGARQAQGPALTRLVKGFHIAAQVAGCGLLN